MAALPLQGNIELPINWTGMTKKVTMEAGSYELSTTVGIRPWVETCSITWAVLSNAEAKSLLDTFKADDWNGVYTYTCPIQGAISLRPTTMYTFVEVGDNSYTAVSVEFRRMK